MLHLGTPFTFFGWGSTTGQTPTTDRASGIVEPSLLSWDRIDQCFAKDFVVLAEATATSNGMPRRAGGKDD